MLIQQCRVCESKDLYPFLDLGQTALANSYLQADQLQQPEPSYPLRTVLCRQCGLVQIDEEVPPETLFKNYLYVSGTSDLVHTHARFLAEHFTNILPLQKKDLVVEAASNDGTVLKAFQKHGVKTVGIEPAVNIAEQANRSGIETVCAFFQAETAQRVRADYGPAKLILARHVLAHVADLHGFVQGLHTMLAEDGVAVVECPHLVPFHDRLEYDTIYHEHLCYFSLTVLQTLFARFDLELIDVLEVAIHGGSIVVSAQRQGGPRQRSLAVEEMLALEKSRGLTSPLCWDAFARRVKQNREQLREEITRIKHRGQSIAGYGAPAKGMTLLSYCGFTPHDVEYLVDRSPLKQGRYTPGHHIPIYAPEHLLQDQPDIVLLLAWNFAAEIFRQQAEYLNRGGKFLLPLPLPTYHGGFSQPTRQAA